MRELRKQGVKDDVRASSDEDSHLRKSASCSPVPTDRRHPPVRAMMVSTDTGAHLHSPAYWMLRQTDGQTNSRGYMTPDDKRASQTNEGLGPRHRTPPQIYGIGPNKHRRHRASEDVQTDSLGRTCSRNCPSDLSPDCPGFGPDRVTVDTDTVHGASRHVRKSSGVIQMPARTSHVA